jgi:3-hydroxyisobutyrate dehydrogenase-like beta-hydroxyacid dehydrogenase
MGEVPTDVRVGFIGLGRLGGPLAANLAEAGYQVTGYDQDPAAAARLGAGRIAAAASTAEAIRGADTVITCVRGSDDLDSALAAAGFDGAPNSVRTVLDFSTISPGDSARVAERLEQSGTAFLRVAVSGSAQAAAARQVSFICSGPRDTYRVHAPLLESIGRSHTWVGSGDEARSIKIAVNVLVGIGMASLIEAVSLAESLNIGRQQFLDVVAQSALASPFFAAKTPALVERDYTPAASLAVMKKDLDLALAACEEVGRELPLTDLVRGLYSTCAERGWAERDFACLDELYHDPGQPPAVRVLQEDQCR